MWLCTVAKGQRRNKYLSRQLNVVVECDDPQPKLGEHSDEIADAHYCFLRLSMCSANVVWTCCWTSRLGESPSVAASITLDDHVPIVLCDTEHQRRHRAGLAAKAAHLRGQKRSRPGTILSVHKGTYTILCASCVWISRTARSSNAMQERQR